MDYRRTIRMYYDYVMPSYQRTPIVFERGRNARLWDSKGKEYLDFFSGYVVSGVGHCNRRVVEAVKKQVEKLIHIPNSYYHEHQGRLAEYIIKNSFSGKVFFANSGAEAIEGAIKLARKYGNPSRHEIITMEKSFHGRTMGALTATGQPKLHNGFGPMVPGFHTVPFNDLDRVKEAITPKTIAILLELIQGEGGIHVAQPEYVKGLRKLCDEQDLLLIFDEVQTGMGRTGKMFCFQNYGIKPDLMVLAKSLGGGIPIGALVAENKVSEVFQPGSHASTFGGNPIACAAGCAVFESIIKDKLLVNAFLVGSYLLKKLQDLKRAFPVVRQVRGLGLLSAIELEIPSKPIQEACMEEGLIVNSTQDTVLRFAPPLTIQEKDVDQAMRVLSRILRIRKDSVLKT